MAGRFAYSKPSRRGPNDPWFRIGNLDIGSAAFLGLLCAVSVLIYALEPVDKPILFKLALIPSEIKSGQVWRVFTWPLANGLDQQLLWVIISIAVLWYFGGRLEEQVGRTRIAWFLAMIIVIPGLVGTALDLPQAGVHTVQLVVLLTYIAEYPNVRFFFGIPAWVLGAVYVAAEVLQLSGDRAGHVCCSSSSRSSSAHSPPERSACSRSSRGSRRSRVPHRRRQPKRSRRPAVVTGPWGRAQLGFRRPERARRSARQDQRHRDGLAQQVGEGTAQRIEQAPSR